jgi:DNA repair exonuclease SbcCD ATPase subunit
MAAEINELFEEGITRSRELTDAADGAMDAIDAMAKDADELAQRVEDEAKEASQHLRELVGRLERAEGELETAHGQAEGALESLAGKAAGLKAEAGEWLERAKKSLAEVESRKDGFDGALDAHMASTQQDFQGLAQETQDAQSHAEEQLQEAAQRIAALRTAIENARAEFTQKQQAWSDAVGELETAIQEKADEWVDGLNELLRRQSQALVGAANAMVDRHNDAMDGLKRRFVEQAPQDLAAAIDPLQAALTALGEEAAERGQRLSSEAQQLEEWVAGALPIVTPIQAALDSAAGLG